jgi:predicted metalloprotease with PDZ domain
VGLSWTAVPAAALALAGAAAAAEPARRTRPIAADYEVTARPGARELRVEAEFDAPGNVLALAEGLGPFVTDGQVARDGRWVRAETRGDALLVPGCQPPPCRVRYTVRLADAALALRDRNRALYHTGAVLATPSTFLARPRQPPRSGDRYRFRVRVPRGSAFVTGVMPAAGEDRYEGRLEDLPLAPYSAFGPLEVTRRRAAGGLLEVAVAPGQRALSREAILHWVERAAAAVAAVYGRLPVPRVAVLVLPGGRRAVGFGSTLGHGGASIVVWLGAQAGEQDLRRDWVLTHEMAHLGLPNLPRDQRWLEEGLATYVEPVARARAGHITAEEAWAGLVAGLPKGLPRDGDGGLDGTRRWGRTYWGGALFYLLADLEIRERTGNRRSLDDALRGIVAAGGTIAVRWPMSRALEAGDRATGVDVLRPLYARLGAARDEVDLEALWSRLGVRSQAGAIHFDDAAPLAAIRRSLTDARDPAKTAAR